MVNITYYSKNGIHSNCGESRTLMVNRFTGQENIKIYSQLIWCQMIPRGLLQNEFIENVKVVLGRRYEVLKSALGLLR